MTKYINYVLLLFMLSTVFCNQDIESQKSSYPLVIDSITVVLNRDAVKLNTTITKGLEAYFGGKGLTLLLSCNVINTTNDTVMTESTAKYKTIYYVDKYLQIDSNKYDFFSNQPLDAYPFICDTFFPLESKRYYLSHWRGPRINNGSKLYFQCKILSGYFRCFPNPDLSISRLDSALNVSVVFIDLESNQVNIVRKPIDSIYEELKKMPGMINISAIK